MLAAYARRLTLEWPVHYTPIMPVLSLASPEEIRAILSETHALWSEGMTREDYMTFVFAQMESPWGRKNFRYLVWKDGDTVLSSLKLYRLDARWGSRRMVLGGIGAVYTPRAHRGQGHARAMLSAVLALMPSEGMSGAVLFSDIGVEYYQRLGFHPLPSHEFSVSLEAVPRAECPRMKVERVQEEDWPEIERLYARATASDPFVLGRSSAYWDYLRQKERERARRLPEGRTSPCHWIIRCGRESVGYALVVSDPPALVLKELIIVEGYPDAAPALWDALRREGTLLTGWWPPHRWSHLLPREHTHLRPRRREVAMLASLDPELDVNTLAACGDLFWATDHF